MQVTRILRAARKRARLTQADLAGRTGTSQATISAYERGRKQPSVETLSRLLAATGARLAVVPTRWSVTRPTPAQHARAARGLLDVLALAEALPTRHQPDLRFPRLETKASLPE
jgi:transcriptional regulator with XRE-family HTH domain